MGRTKLELSSICLGPETLSWSLTVIEITDHDIILVAKYRTEVAPNKEVQLITPRLRVAPDYQNSIVIR